MTNPWEDDGPWNDGAEKPNILTTLSTIKPQKAPKRTLGEAVNDAAIVTRSGTRNVTGGLLGAPVDIANLVTQRGPEAILSTLSPVLGSLFGGSGARPVLGEITRPAIIQQPDVVRGMREGIAMDNAADEADLTPWAKGKRAELQATTGFIPSVKKIAVNPAFAASVLLPEQIPQIVLGTVPGSTLGTLALQGVSAGGQSESQVVDELRKQGVAEDDIARAGADSFGQSALVNTALAKVIPGGTFVERAQAGRFAPKAGSFAARMVEAGKNVAGEVTTNTAEEYADQVQQNLNTNKPWNEGAGQAGALGALLGTGTAGPVALGSLATNPNVLGAPPEAPIDIPPVMPEVVPPVAPVVAPQGVQPTMDPAVAPEATGDIDAMLAPLVDAIQKDPEAAAEMAKSVLGDTQTPTPDPAPEPVPVEALQPEAPTPQVAPEQTSTPDADKQNRDRSRIASREQMQDIRRNPDAARLGFSRDSNTGAPLINQGDAVADTDIGKSDVIITPEGRRVPVRYAVIEADAAQASHDADGNVNPAYNDASMQALNNGRTAGIQAAWRSGNGEAYRQGLIDDAAMHGVSAEAIASKKYPMLVRLVDPAEKMTGAESNASQQLGMSPTEQAKTDASYLPDLSGLDWSADGSISPVGNANFFRGWFNKMGATGTANMLDPQGRPNAEALRRLKGALMFRAYGDERLLSALVEDTDDDSRNITNALARAAPAFSALDDAHPLTAELRGVVTGAMQLYRDAKARGLSITDFVGQGDLLGRDVNADRLAMFYADNARSSQRMAAGLAAIADAAADEQAHSQTLDVFGGRPEARPADILDRANIGDGNGSFTQGTDARVNGKVADGSGAGRQQNQILGADAGSSVREESAGLFGKPQGADYLDAARRAKDAKRDGKTGTGRTDMLSGDGELFAGDRPEQGDIETGTLSAQNDTDYGKTRPLFDSSERDGIAESRDASGRRPAPALRGQLDLFVSRREQSSAPAVQLDKAKLLQTSKLIQTGEFRSGIDRVRNLADAAHIFAPLRKSPQEQFLVLAMDAEGRPLAVLRHTVGLVDQSLVDAGTVLGAVASIQGVSSVAFAHNHPSSSTNPSAGDKAVDAQFENVFNGSGIDIMGSVIVQPGRDTFTMYTKHGEIGSNESNQITRAPRKTSVPQVERTFNKIQPVKGRTKVSDPAISKRLARDYHKENRAGVILLNHQHELVGHASFNPDSSKRLRTGDIETSHAPVIRDAISANASAVIVYGDMADEDGVQNMARAYHLAGIRAIDSILFDGSDIISMAARGQSPPAGPLFSVEGSGRVYEDGKADVPQALKRWVGDAPMIDGADMDEYAGGPAVFVMHHGTTATFDTFAREKANPESDLGAGFYFSNNAEDVDANYSGIGPDLQGKIDREAERIAGETDREYDDPDVIAEATARWVQHDGETLNVYVKVKDPAIVGGNAETFLDYNESFDAETDEYGEPEGVLAEVVDSMREVADEFSDLDVEKVIAEVMEAGYDGGLKLSDFIDIVKKSESAAYTSDPETGDLVVGEFIRRALESTGYDAIVDYTVDSKFGSQRKTGKSMAGMDDGTVHVIAFKPEQIKSSDKNNGNFDPEKPSIYERQERSNFTNAIRRNNAPDESRQRGEDDAYRLGIRSAVESAVGKFPVEYLHGIDGLPPGLADSVRRRLEQRGGKGRTAGLYDADTGKVYLFTDVVTDPARAAFTAAHEIAGHHGLRKLLGPSLDPVLRLAGQNPTVRELADAITLDRRLKPNQDLLAVEEALAELAGAVRTGDFAHLQSRYDVNVPQGIRQRIATLISNFLKRVRELFAARDIQFTDKDVRALLEAAWQAADESSASIEGEGGQLEQVVFHGTPHTVDKFSLQKIGTGEGAQAYGWGMYFASNKDIAKYYKETTSILRLTGVDGKKYGDSQEGAESTARALLAQFKSDRKSFDGYDDGGKSYMGKIARDIRKGVIKEAHGKLYRVEVPEDSDLLDWDKPLSEQPEKVQAAIIDALGKVRVTFKRDGATVTAHGPDGRVMGAARKGAADSLSNTKLRAAFTETVADGKTIYQGFADILSKHDESWQTIGLTPNDVRNVHEAASRVLNAAGIPGLRYLDGGSRDNGEGSHNYVIWDESAIGDPEALESVAESRTEAAKRRSVAASTLGVSRGAPGWNAETGQYTGIRKRVHEMRLNFQDKMKSWDDVQKDIESQTGALIDDAANVYQLENLMHGKVATGVENIERNQLNPLLTAMKKAGVSAKTVEEYLYARHAEERNKQIASINPKMPDGGSGMSTADAKKILASADTAKLEPLAKMVDAITATTRKRMLDHGLITQDQYDAMTKQYAHYVPLRGKEESAGGFDPNLKNSGSMGGRGVDSRGKPLKAAFGRGEGNMAHNILGEIIGDAQRSVILAEKARVGRAAMRLVLQHPNPSLWTLEPVQTGRALNSKGEVYEKVMQDLSDPSIIAVRHKGKLYRVQIQNADLARALNLVGVDQMPGFLRAGAAINRYFSAVLTKYNPAFTGANMTRDAIFGLTGLASTHGEAVAAKAAAAYPSAARSAWKLARGNLGTSKMDVYAREFADIGGRTGYVGMPSVEDIARQVNNTNLSSKTASAKRAVKQVADVIGDMNDAVENALRLSTFATLRDGGMSVDKAAIEAKNLTVNFNRKGFYGSHVGAAILFFNASMQGTHRVATVLTKPKTWAYLSALTSVQVIATMFAMGITDDDDEPVWNKVPDHLKRRNIVIVTPEGNILTIPMPYGFNVFTFMGGAVTSQLMNEQRGDTSISGTAGDLAGQTMLAVAESFSPIPLDTGVRTIVPTQLGGIAYDIANNETSLGGSIRKENPWSDQPRAAMGKPDTMELFKWMAKGWNRVGGGDDFSKPKLGLFDRAPEDFEYLAEQLAGGAGKFIVDMAALGSKAMDPDAKLTLNDLPVSNRFGRVIDEHASQRSMYFERKDSIEESKRRVKAAFGSGSPAEIARAEALLKELPGMSGARFKRRKNPSKNGPAGGVTTINGSPQLEAMEGSAFKAFKDADKAYEARNDVVSAAYGESPKWPVSTDKSRAREAKVRAADADLTVAFKKFNGAWTREASAKIH